MLEKKAIQDKNVLTSKKHKALNQESFEIKAIVCQQGNFRWISPNTENILGYLEEQLVDKCFFDFIHPDDKKIVKNAFEKIGSQLKIECPPYRFKSKKENWKWLKSIVSNQVDNDSINGYVINSIDSTNLIEAQNNLKKNNDRIELLNKLTDNIVYEGDFITKTYEFSTNFYSYFNIDYKSAGFYFKDWEAIIHPADYNRIKSNWENFIKDPESNKWIGEYRIKKQDNTYFYIEDTAYVIRNSDGEPQKTIGTIRDNNTKKNIEIKEKIQAQLAAIFKEKASLIAILKNTLQFLLECEDFLTAEIWILNNENNKLNLIQSCSRNEVIELIYNKTNNVYSVIKGEGLPGAIFFNKKAEIWNYKEIQEKCRNTELVEQIGIKSVLGIPLFHNNNFFGTVLLSTKEDIKNDNIRTEPFTALCHFLGAEIKRKEQEEMLYQMFKSATDILAIVNSNGFFTKINPAFSKLLGYSEEEIISKPYTYFLHPDDLSKSHEEFDETIKGKRNANNFTNRYRTKNGEYKWISWNSSDVFGEEGQVFAYGKNVTDIKELEQLLLQTAKLAQIGSWEYTLKNNKEIYVSNVIKEIFEIDKKTKIKYLDFFNYFYEQSKTEINKSFHDLINSGENFDKEFEIITSNNTIKWIRCIGQADYNSNGKCVKISGSIQNIDSQKNNELELAKKNNYLSALTDIITELLKPKDWFESLNNVFRITGNTINVDRIYYFETHENSKTNQITCNQKIEWTQEAIETKIDNPIWQNLPIEDFNLFFKNLNKGEPFTTIVSQLPKGKLKNELVKQNVKSLLILPVIIDNLLHGFIGFDNCFHERKWKFSEISFLNNVTANLASIIQRMNVQKDLENTLKERNNILESIGDAFFMMDKDCTVTYWNKESEKITGVKREQLIGKNFWDFFPHLKGSIYDVNYKKSLKANKNIYIQDYFDYLNIWLDVSAYPSKEGLSVYFKDITTTRKYEEELRSSNERFEKSTLATNDAIWDWNLEENSIYRGKGFQKLFGYAVPDKIYNIDVLGLIKSRIHIDDAEEAIDSLKRAIENPKKTNWEKEYRYIKANEKYAFVINRGIIVRNAAGVATRIVGALQDISLRKENEESLKILNKKLEKQTKDLMSSNQELEQFAYIASHDLQEPLRMVTSFLTQLENKYHDKLDTKGKQYIHFAVDGANRMRNIILDILEYSKVGKNAEEERQLISLNNIVQEACAMNQKVVEEKNATVIYGDLPNLYSYRSPLLQIFHNLIGNGIKYQKPDNNPVIEISCTESNKNWEFKIADNGIGIANEYLDKIFVIFQRLHSKSEYSGTGMGLAIVKKLVENLGGKIWVESEIKKGSTFYFTLPKK